MSMSGSGWAAIGFAGDKFAAAYGGQNSGAFDWNIGGTVSYAVTEAVAVSGYVIFSDNVESDVLPDQPTDIYGGGGISYSF